MQDMPIPEHQEPVWLIGFRVDPDREQPEFYTLVIGDDERPLLADGRIVLFTDPELATEALELADIDVHRLGPLPSEVCLVCDVAEALYLLDSQTVDPSATIINLLNTLFDMVKGVGEVMPPEFKKVLYPLADHLTFEREFGSFIDQEHITRSAATDGIYWCLGVMFAYSRVLVDRQDDDLRLRRQQQLDKSDESQRDDGDADVQRR